MRVGVLLDELDFPGAHPIWHTLSGYRVSVLLDKLNLPGKRPCLACALFSAADGGTSTLL